MSFLDDQYRQEGSFSLQSRSVVQDVDTRWRASYPIRTTSRVVNENQLKTDNININIQPSIPQASVNHQLQQVKLVFHELAPSLAGRSICWHLHMKSGYQFVDINLNIRMLAQGNHRDLMYIQLKSIGQCQALSTRNLLTLDVGARRPQ